MDILTELGLILILLIYRGYYGKNTIVKGLFMAGIENISSVVAYQKEYLDDLYCVDTIIYL